MSAKSRSPSPPMLPPPPPPDVIAAMSAGIHPGADSTDAADVNRKKSHILTRKAKKLSSKLSAGSQHLKHSDGGTRVSKFQRKMSPPVQRPSQLPLVSSYAGDHQDVRHEIHKGRLAGVKRSQISPGRSPKRMATCMTSPPIRSRSPSENPSRHSSPDDGLYRKANNGSSSRMETDKPVNPIRIYLLDFHLDKRRFFVAENSTEHIFTVQIGPQVCSCGSGDICVHILFIMLRVFRLHEMDEKVVADRLSENEVEELLEFFEEERKISNFDVSDSIFEEFCPICYLRAEDDDHAPVRCESVRACIFHQKCFSLLVEFFERNRTGSRPTCPSCGGSWCRDLEVVNRHSSKSTSLSTPISDLWQDPFAYRDPVNLPTSAPIPQQHWTVASSWIQVVGRDLVACFFSKDWILRESSLHRLAFELTSVFRSIREAESQQQEFSVEKVVRLWQCSAEMITRAVEDKTQKVYVAALKCLHTLIASTREVDAGEDTGWLRPILQTVFLKCADANRRIAQISMSTMLEIAKGIEGELYLSKSSSMFDGVDLVLSTMFLEDREPYGKSWQYALGRLIVLDSILEEFSSAFYFDTLSTLEFERTMLALDFGFRLLESTHINVSKMARKVFVAAAKMSCSHRRTYDQVLRMISTLDPNLQERIRRRLIKTSLTHLNEQVSILEEDIVFQVLNESNAIDRKCGSSRPKLLRSFSHSPSRTGSHILSPSQSPSRKQTPYHHVNGKRSTPLMSTKLKLSKPLKSRSFLKPSFHLSNIVDGRKKRNFSFLNSRRGSDADQRHKENFCLRYATYNFSDENHQHPLPVVLGLTQPPETENDLHSHAQQEIDHLQYLEGKHWTKGALLGTGAYSSCYQARDIRSGTLMAVKQISVLRSSEEEQEKVEQLIWEEVHLLSFINHRHIVRMYGAAQEGNTVNLFVEWMAGGSVSNLLDKHGVFTEPVIISYTKQILLGLQYLHCFGILHRDLKGANLLVDTTGQHLRIADFGAAARLSSSTAMTIPGEFRGQLQGTIAFMAPEVLRGENYGRSCDIWSLGCCIVEMSTSKPPWNQPEISNHYALMFKIARSQESPELPGHISPNLRDFCQRCLAINPEMRPTADDLLLHPVITD